MPAPYKMGRPPKLPDLVYRVQYRRPEHGDSRIYWTTAPPHEIKARYGDKVILITPYRKEKP